MLNALPETLDLNHLPEEVAPLQVLVKNLAMQLQAAQERIESLHQQFLNLRRAHFGSRSEQLAALQPELFVETLNLPVPPVLIEKISYERPQSKGRPKLPKDLPRQRIDYELSESERAEFDHVERIGEEISETLEYTPSKVVVLEHARGKYRCEKDGESTIRTAAAQPSPLAKCNAGAGLLAQILVAKYGDGLPLNRQSKIFKRHGVHLSRTTLCDWVLGSTELLYLLMPLLRAHLLRGPVIFGDDTPHDLLVAGRGSPVTARLWAYVSAGQRWREETGWLPYPRAVYFEFTTSREARHPLALLRNYEGYLQADDYSGWNPLLKLGRIQHVACWSHARRPVWEVAKNDLKPGLAAQALGFIAELYATEGRLRGQTPDERLLGRQTETLPLLEQFHQWLSGHYPTLLPRGPLAKAFYYILSNWEALKRFTSNGILEADSNLVERSIRPVAIGRRAYFFFAAASGGRAAATAFSLIETCKLNNVEPYAYLKDVLARIGSHRQDRLAELLPFNWKPLAVAVG